MIELKNSKTTFLPNGKVSLDCFLQAVQMKDTKGDWQDIKPKLVRDADGWHIEGAPYHAEFKDDGTRLFCPDRNEPSKFLRLPAIPLFKNLPKNIVQKPAVLDGELLPNQIAMPAGDWGEIRIIFTNTGMRFEILFTKAPPASIFGKDSPKILLDVETSGLDIAQLLKATEGIGIPKPRLLAQNIISARESERRLEWSFNGSQLELGFDLTGLTFPVLLKNTTLDVQVNASANDGTWYPNSYFDNTWTRVWVGNDATYGVCHGFLRFTGVSIDQGSTIDACYISVVNDNGTGQALTNLYFEKSSNPSAPTSYSDCDSRTLTTSYTAWDNAPQSGSYQDSPSMVNPLQELVNAYSTGGAVIVFHKDDGSASGKLMGYRSYDYGSEIPKLHIEYTAGGATAKSSSDSGTGTDAKVNYPTVTIAKSDSGSGTDSKGSGVPVAILAGLDTAQGLESSLLLLLLSSLDSGQAYDALVFLFAQLGRTDAGSGTESLGSRRLWLTEGGAGSDLSSLLVAIVRTESASGQEQSGLSLLRVAQDSGTGVAAGVLFAGMTKADGGAGVEAVTGRDISRGESGGGTEGGLSLLAVLNGGELGQGADAQVLFTTVAKLAADAGLGAEAAVLLVRLLSGDAARGLDNGYLVGLRYILSGEAGNGKDVLKALIMASRGVEIKLGAPPGQTVMPSKEVSL